MTRLAGILAVLLSLAPAAAGAQVDAELDYRVSRRATGTSGAYAGWADELLASGHYSVTAPPGSGPVAVHGAYQWRYTSPESLDSGSEDRHVTVERATRHYVDRTDLDEYDGADASTLTTWLYVPLTVDFGDIVHVLDEDFLVMETHEPIEIAGAPRDAIHLSAHGDGTRDDAYGQFDTRYDDHYWFDATTGMFLRELRTETDTGTTEGTAATLGFREEVVVVDASYARHVGPVPPDPMLRRSVHALTPSLLERYQWPLVALIFVLTFVFLRWVLGRAPRGVPALRGRPIRTRRLGGEDPIPAFPADTSISFGAFLPHFVRIARATSNDVWLAEVDGTIVGLALDDASTGVASIFAREPDVCETLRRAVGKQDFFSEVRHGNLPSVIEATATTGDKLPAAAAYNVLETYDVLSLEKPGSPAYDTAVITRLEAAEVAASDLLTRVLGAPSEAYLKAAMAAGDLAYVARSSGSIVGVGLATVVGTQGRMHTLAVDPAHRNKGLGRELVRARVRAMAALGAERIVTEISAQNSASLEIARGEGFATVATMYLETARDAAPASARSTVRK